MMKYSNFKCPNCGSNLVINKLNRTGKCQYCGNEVIYDLQEDELTRLINSANAHIKLNDRKILKKDCNVLYEKYPGNPITYYFLAKADLMEINTLIQDKQMAPRCNYLLSCVYQNLLRLKEFNTDKDIDPLDVIKEYNNYANKNNDDMAKLVSSIRLKNMWSTLLSIGVLLLIICLTLSSLFFLGILLILIGVSNRWYNKLYKRFKKVPTRTYNPPIEY